MTTYVFGYAPIDAFGKERARFAERAGAQPARFLEHLLRLSDGLICRRARYSISCLGRLARPRAVSASARHGVPEQCSIVELSSTKNRCPLGK